MERRRGSEPITGEGSLDDPATLVYDAVQRALRDVHGSSCALVGGDVKRTEAVKRAHPKKRKARNRRETARVLEVSPFYSPGNSFYDLGGVGNGPNPLIEPNEMGKEKFLKEDATRNKSNP